MYKISDMWPSKGSQPMGCFKQIIYVHHIHAVPAEAARDHTISWNWSYKLWAGQSVFWESKWSLLQEQQILWIIKPTLQSLHLLWSGCKYWGQVGLLRKSTIVKEHLCLGTACQRKILIRESKSQEKERNPMWTVGRTVLSLTMPVSMFLY